MMNNNPITSELEVYAVYDTETETFWETPKGKRTWRKPNFAKNAVNANPPDWMKRPQIPYHPGHSTLRGLKFSEQTRLRVVKAKFTLKNTEML